MRYRRNSEETNFWAGYADCMLALFMIALVLWILSAGVTAFSEDANAGIVSENERLQDEIARLRKENKTLIADITELEKGEDWYRKHNELKTKFADLKRENDRLEQKLEDLRKGKVDIVKVIADNERLKGKVEDLMKRLNDKPPIISLAEGVTRAYRFRSGEATIPPDFQRKLTQEIFPEVRKILENYQTINTLEIVGHTDGEKIDKHGDLDRLIPGVLDGRIEVGSLTAGSNADLGLMRALAIRNTWLEWLNKEDFPAEDFALRKRFQNIDVRCYSAAQTIPPGSLMRSRKEWEQDNPQARRIEIRFTQLKKN